MAISHRNGDARVCGASTIVEGQGFVTINGQLWSVDQDPESHGGGNINTSNAWLTISGKGIIVVGDSSGADNLCIPIGPPHCSPSSASGDSMVVVL
jgi:hypothetical protein